jgi:hypothetical protein
MGPCFSHRRVQLYRPTRVPAFVFLSTAAMARGLRDQLGIEKELIAVENARRGISKKSMAHDGATPMIEVDPVIRGTRTCTLWGFDSCCGLISGVALYSSNAITPAPTTIARIQ